MSEEICEFEKFVSESWTKKFIWMPTKSFKVPLQNVFASCRGKFSWRYKVSQKKFTRLFQTFKLCHFQLFQSFLACAIADFLRATQNFLPTTSTAISPVTKNRRRTIHTNFSLDSNFSLDKSSAKTFFTLYQRFTRINFHSANFTLHTNFILE